MKNHIEMCTIITLLLHIKLIGYISVLLHIKPTGRVSLNIFNPEDMCHNATLAGGYDYY